jgi:dipeptidyl aminopeptidase/acylaminoacyl peptidase
MLHRQLTALSRLLLFTMLLTSTSIGQEGTADAKANESAPAPKAKTPRALKLSDTKQWEQAIGFTVSLDANWFAYFQRPVEGDGTIRIEHRTSDKRYEFKCGSSSGSITFSHNSQWVAFRSSPLEKVAKAAKKAKKPAASQVVLLSLKSGKDLKFENAGRFAFSGETDKFFAVHKAVSGSGSASPSGDEPGSGRDLILHELSNGRNLNLGNIGSFEFNKSGKWLALTIDAAGNSGNGLQLFDVANNQISVLESDKAKFRKLKWTKEGDAFALLKVIDSAKHEESLQQVLAYSNLDATPPNRVHIDPDQQAGIPESMTISSHRQPTWTKNRDGLLFGIHEPKIKAQAKKADEEKGADDGSSDSEKKRPTTSAPSGGDAEDADLVIWHWEDERLQSRQQVQATQDKQFNYLCLFRVVENKTLRLADDDMRSVTPLRPHRYAIAFDATKYELAGNLNGRRFRDVYSIDLETGKKKLARKKVRWYISGSPTGDKFLYYENKHFHVYDLVTSTSRNITAESPVSFVNDEDDHNVKNPPTRPIGWTKDGASVLISDNWDIWLVPVSGGQSVKLTERGRKDGIRFSSRYRLDPDEEGIDLSQPIYLRTYGEWTKESGIGRITNGRPGVEMLLWKDADVRSLRKVKDQDAYYFTQESQTDSRDTFICGADFKDPQRATTTNAQQKDFLWSEGSQLVEYKSKQGDRLQASLFLPANYVEGKSYPTIVYIYEKLSQRRHRYDAPRIGGFSMSLYTSRGYAVLMPDIVYRVNKPGESAVDCVLPALDAAIKTGVVDPEHVGLHGHSWGGYQTAFLITQTKRFQAAVAGAPLTNLISMYSSIYWNSGMPNQPIFESSQGRFTGGYWTNIKAYTTNSPVYHAKNVQTPLLLLHNDKDGAVDWNQGIEYFNTLRRLKKPVVMLQYKGENHGLAKTPNKEDYSHRMLQFFDHHLRGEDPPKWWKEGVPHLELKDHIKQQRQQRESK